MFCTDLFEAAAIHPTLNNTREIAAQNIRVALVGELISEFFDLNRRLDISLFP